MKCRPGFTLLEVLLALALMVVVLGLLGMAVDVHVRVADASRYGVEEIQSARLLLRQIAADLRCAIPVIQTSSSTSSSASSSASSSMSSSTSSSIGCLQGDSHELQVDISRMPFLDAMSAAESSRGNTLPAFPPSDVRTISYLVAKPGDMELAEIDNLPEQSGGLLRRECERATFAWADEQGQTDTFNRAIKVLSPEVEAIEFTYIDGGTTYQEWDSSQEGKLPAAVKITISMRGQRRKPQALFDSSTLEEAPTTAYSILVDLPNARATLDKTLTALGGQSTSASQGGTASGSTNAGSNSSSAGGTGSSQTKPSNSGGAGQ
jgi:prepilin-type N-terminal cleavage/methylation domain-containing protein